jgi:hypothetical protein
MKYAIRTSLLIAVAAAIAPTAAMAYVGPGAGLSAIGAFFALVSACFLGIVGFVWYPIRRLLRGAKSKTAQATAAPQQTQTSQAAQLSATSVAEGASEPDNK